MSFEKFDGKNFRQWKFQINCALRARGLDIKKPKPVSNSDQWDKDDGKAMFIITSALDLHQVALVENCVTAAEVMEKLESIYEQKSELHKMILHERFYGYRMTSKDTIAHHISNVERLAKELRDSGERVSDTAIITKILYTLPPKYRSLRQAWLSLDTKYQTVGNLTARLLDEEVCLGIENEEEMAFLVAKENKFKNNFRKTSESKEEDKYERQSTTKHRFPCYNCGKRGHFSRECLFRRNTSQESRNIPVSRESEDVECEKWFLDSGASAHMCYKRGSFQEMKTYVGSPLKLGDGNILEVHGIGNILINKNIQGKWEKNILKNVLYVPQLKRNLISEGVLARKGFEIFKIGTNAMIYEGNNLILHASLKNNNLYEMNMKVIRPDEECNIVASIQNESKVGNEVENDVISKRHEVKVIIRTESADIPVVMKKFDEVKSIDEQNTNRYRKNGRSEEIKLQKKKNKWRNTYVQRLTTRFSSRVKYDKQENKVTVKMRNRGSWSSGRQLETVESGPVLWSSGRPPHVCLLATETDFRAGISLLPC